MQTETVTPTTTETAAPMVPEIPAESLERIGTRAPILPAGDVPRVADNGGATRKFQSAPRAWRASGMVD